MEVGKRHFLLCRYKDVQISPLVRDFNGTFNRFFIPCSSELGGNRANDPPRHGGLALCADGRQSRSPCGTPLCKAIASRKVNLSVFTIARFSELLFEKFKVPGLMMYKDAALTCFARGRTTGMSSTWVRSSRVAVASSTVSCRARVSHSSVSAERVSPICILTSVFPPSSNHKMSRPSFLADLYCLLPTTHRDEYLREWKQLSDEHDRS